MEKVVLRVPATPLQRRRGRIILGLIFALPVIFLCWRIYIHFAVAANLDSIRKTGYPISFQELGQKYYAPVSQGENSALLYLEALKDLESTNGYKGCVPFFNEPTLASRQILFSAEGKTRAVNYLDKNRGVLEALGRVSSDKPARYPMDFSKGMMIETRSHLGKVADGVRLLLLATLFESEAGRVDEAVNDIAAASRLLRSVGDEPLLVSQMVLLGGRRQMFGCLERMLNGRALTEAQLFTIAEIYGKCIADDGIDRALAGERCMGIWMFQVSPHEIINSSQGDTAKNRKTGLRLMRLSGFLDRDLNYYLGMMKKEISMNQMPVPSMLQALEKLEEEHFRTVKRNGYFFSAVVMPAYSGAQKARVDDMARSEIFKTVVAVERFRLANQSKLPERLDALVPKFLEKAPVDPYDGKILRFKPTGKGYVVYSIGRDQKDDGGRGRDEDNPKSDGDVVFTMER